MHFTFLLNQIRTLWKRFRGVGVIFPFIIVIGAFLRFYGLDSYGLWHDEFLTWILISNKNFGEIIRTCFVVPQPLPPLFFLLEKGMVNLLGPSEVALRICSALSSTLLIIVLFQIGRVLFDRSIAWAATLLYSTATIQLVYAQNARPYAYCLLLSGVSILAFLKWLQGGTYFWLIIWFISTLGLFYSHYIFFSLPITQTSFLLYLRLRRKRRDIPQFSFPPWRQWLAGNIFLLLLLFPLIPQIQKMISEMNSLSWIGGTPQFQNVLIFFNHRYLIFSLVITGLLYLGGRYWQRIIGKKRMGKRTEHQKPGGFTDSFVFFGLWFCIHPMLLFLVYETTGIVLFSERYLLPITLPAYLLLPAFVLGIKPCAIGRLFIFVYVLYCGLSGPGTSYWKRGTFSTGTPTGNQWRQCLTMLNNSPYKSRLLLFQSPYVESDHSREFTDSQLAVYLSAPYHSFYVKEPQGEMVLLPLHWDSLEKSSPQFKNRLREQLICRQEFSLFSSQEFWLDFSQWLNQTFKDPNRATVIQIFQSSGTLRLTLITIKQES